MLYFLIIAAGIAALLLMVCIADEEMQRRTHHYRSQLHTAFVHCESDMEAQLHRTYYVIGRRRRRADLALDFCNDPSIARIHAIMWYDGTQFCIAPARNGYGSNNSYPAVFVNGIQIPISGAVVAHGDVIQLGNSHFILKDTEKVV